MRQIILDTETTGLEPREGHRIVEIGAVELVNRSLTKLSFHEYLNPERIMDDEVIRVHGLTNAFLDDKPLFAAVAQPFLDFVRGAELIIHNAAFDLGFINHELAKLDAETGTKYGRIEDHVRGVVDSLKLARRLHPGQRNSLDALCRRYSIDNSHRQLHGALLDAEILADVYLAMTGGQSSLGLESHEAHAHGEGGEAPRPLPASRPRLAVLRANAAELEAHEQCMAAIQKAAGGMAVWKRCAPGEVTG
ncbi:MAG: DNA polymerase III subunit epsilon [Halothiobacillaceae bacterium]|nr:DNA polymerase III subunit epsilon [Halothiobacillaceae bacterium]